MSIDVKNLHIESLLTSKNIVENLNFSVEKGERLAIVGESGCGKTMTSLAILGLLPSKVKSSGEIFLEKIDLMGKSQREMGKIRGRDVVLIPQSGSDFLNPSLKVKYQMFESLKLLGVSGKEAMTEMAKDVLRKVGFAKPEVLLEMYPFQLSGGMAQRIILAIGLMASPKLVIADEPTRGIDKENSQLFMESLFTLYENSAVILITHSLGVARNCHKVLVMKNGKMVEYGESGKVLNNPEMEYTKQLLSYCPHQIVKAKNNN